MAALFRDTLARAQDFLLESAQATPVGRRCTPSQIEVVVLGLSAGCGVTTLARGLAISLRVPGQRPSHLLGIGHESDGRHEAVPSAAGPSALVWDVASSDAALARGVARRANAVVLVAGTQSEPALAELAAHLLSDDLGRVVLVANRVTDVSRWDGRHDLCVPESRLGAALVGRGRSPAGAFRAALVQLGELVEER